jgi:Domain of unknown function (DUF955).
MERLIEVATREGLQIKEFTPLPESYLGLYYCEDGYLPVAFLSEKIYGQRKLERVVLAEEIGHHLTTFDHTIPYYFESYKQKLKLSKSEYKALRKGSQLLIYPEEILEAVAHGIEEVWELAEHFNVTDDFMAFRLKAWQVSGN